MASTNPEDVLNLDENYQKALGVIRKLSEFTAGDYQITRETGISANQSSGFNRGPGGFNNKFARGSGGYRGGNSGGFNRGGFNNRRGFGYGR